MPCGSTKDSNQQDKNGENGHCAFDDLDHSILQHSFNLGVTNVKQILKCIQNGSKEVKDIILNECNIIYECKVCANLFRSLANFLYHKRCYCKKHLCEGMLLFENFEETPTVVVQPEPSDKEIIKEGDNLPQMTECTVDLVKTDLVSEKHFTVSGETMDVLCGEQSAPKEKLGRSKVNKVKEQADDSKKPVKATRTVSPMISRRTREKNSINASKRALKSAADPEPPKKSVKSVNKVTAVSKVPTMNTEEFVKGSEKSLKGNKEHKKGQDEPIKVNNEAIKINDESIKTNDESIKTNDESIKTNDESIKTNNDSIKTNNDSIKTNDEHIKINDQSIKINDESININDEQLKINDEPVEVNDEPIEVNGEPIEVSSEPIEVNGESIKIIDEPMKELDDVRTVLETNEEKLGSKEIICINKAASNLKRNTAEEHDLVCVTPPKQMFAKPLKKIIITNPKSADIKNSSVFDNIRKNLKSNKIGFTNISNSSGKNLQCFPKIIFKTIDGNPHAVFQSTDSAKFENAAFKSKFESSKVDNEKLIIVLKKDSGTPVAEQKQASEKPSKLAKNQNEFHLTRRKRLLARSDCNVQELKCLNCKTQFTSLKTLYFHMLSIHSKKRLYYPCPFCKTLFVQMYGVTRHLVSIHNKTKEQINKLRDIIKKKSVWKKIDDVNIRSDEILNEIQTENVNEETKPEIKHEDTIQKQDHTALGDSEHTTLKTVIKLSKDVTLHKCSKCSRVFGRKSSQVSHEKFCIMNAIKVETVDLTGVSPISPPPNVSFLSLSPKKADPDQFQQPVQQQKPSDIKVSTRPKRGAEKQMHKDFVDSQTLKWRSANTNSKATTSVKKTVAKNIEKKVLNIMNVENLLCMKCDKTFSSYSNLRRHVAIHVGWNRFKCKYCEYQAYNKSRCWAHVQKAHAVPEEELEKSVLNISKSPIKKPPSPNVGHLTKHSELKAKRLSPKMNAMSKVKISKKKTVSGARTESEKKQNYLKKRKLGKKDTKKEKSQYLDSKKEVYDSKKVKSQYLEGKREISESKKEKSSSLEIKKDYSSKKEKSQNFESKKVVLNARQDKIQNMQIKKDDTIREKSQSIENKDHSYDNKKEKSHSLGSIIKFSVPQFKKETSNYKSLTTNNPTTIILSKKFPTSTVPSFLTISPESLSSSVSSKTFPLRSSPRKSDGKIPEENSLTSLVTRSSAYTKSGPITIKMPVRSNSTEERQKSPTISPEKNYARKDKLISEWFPKKDINSNSARRESAPLIIGLVPAANTAVSPRAKSPAFSYERNHS